MFLMSDACRALDERELRRWDWRATSIFYISHSWNPARDGAESLAGRRLARVLLEAGARVHVLTAGRGDDEFPYYNYDVTVVPGRPLSSHKLGRALQMVRSTIPEAAGQWVGGAVHAGARVLSTLPADTIIYGRAMPGSSNIVAWHLARLTGLPWVAHFSDEWPPIQVLSNGRKWLAPYKWPLFRFWRHRIIRDAGALTFTNPWQGKDVLGHHGTQYLSKAFVVTHLPSQLAPRNEPPQYDVFHIVHTGNFYPPGHTSAAVMQGLRLFLDRTPAARGRVRFTQAGWSNGDLPAWTVRCWLGDVVRLAGRLSHPEVVALVNAASLLLAVDYARPNSRTVLSKLPDYINAGRPILAITSPSASLSRLFRDDGAGLTAHYESPEEVAAQIEAVFDAWQHHRLDPFLPKPAARESFTPRRVLAELAGAFETARLGRRAAEGSPYRRLEPDGNRSRHELPRADSFSTT